MSVYTATITSDADDGTQLDDGTWNSQTSEGYADGEFFEVYFDNGTSDTRMGGVRFVTFSPSSIPQGSTITAATLTVNVRVVSSIDPVNSVFLVHGENVDNAGALGASDRLTTGFTATSASASQAGIAVGDVAIDVTSIVQEIVNRGGFGGNLCFRIQPSGSDTYWSTQVADFDADTTSTKARLSVTTSDGGAKLLTLLGVG